MRYLRNSKWVWSGFAALVIGFMASTALATQGNYNTSHYQGATKRATKQDAGASRAFDTGMITAGTYGDSDLGFISELGVASYLGTQRHALALLVNGGPNVLRANVTYGVSLTDKQRVKISAEHLEERRQFDFVTGRDRVWDAQQAVGGDYAYLLDNAYIKAITAGGHYAQSHNHTLSNVTVTNFDNDKFLEIRRVAGARSGNIHTDITMQLWPYSRLTGGMDYDIVRFKSRYTQQNTQGLGGHVQVEQRILPQLKASVATQLQTTDHYIAASVGWLVPATVPMELKAGVSYTDSQATHRRFYTSGLRLNLALEQRHPHRVHRYYPGFEHDQPLLHWTRQSAARMSHVLAVSDAHYSQVAGGAGGRGNTPSPWSQPQLQPQPQPQPQLQPQPQPQPQPQLQPQPQSENHDKHKEHMNKDKDVPSIYYNLPAGGERYEKVNRPDPSDSHSASPSLLAKAPLLMAQSHTTTSQNSSAAMNKDKDVPSIYYNLPAGGDRHGKVNRPDPSDSHSASPSPLAQASLLMAQSHTTSSQNSSAPMRPVEGNVMEEDKEVYQSQYEFSNKQDEMPYFF